jgi:hypothetical protein
LEELKYLLSNYFEKLNIQGIFGTQKVKNYYETNKASVAIFRKWDIFDFEHKLPACLLKIPYNLLNRLNRYKLLQQNNKHITDISTDDFYLSDFNITAYDFFVIAENKKQ